MLKVLHVYKSFFPDSEKEIERYIYNVCKSTEKYGVSHTVLCTYIDGDEPSAIAFDGIPILKYPYSMKSRSCPISFKLFMSFKKEIEHADIIHYHHPWLFGDLLSFLNRKKKHVVTYHSGTIKQRHIRKICSFLDRYFLSKADRLITTVPNHAESYKDLKNFSDKISIIPNTLIEDNYPAPNILFCRQIKMRFRKFLLCIEQPRSNKGLSLLIDAMKELSYDLIIIRASKYKNKSSQVYENKVNDNVYFFENISKDKKINCLHSCNCVISPSVTKVEAGEISLLEGAMFGKPLISCDIKNAEEYINIHNETGLVFSPTVSDLRAKIIKLMSNEDYAKRLGRNAFKRFYKFYNSDIVGKQLANLYKEIMTEDLHKNKVLT